jgi:alpha-glucosidase
MANTEETPSRPQLVNIKDIPTGERFPDAYELFIPNQVVSFQQDNPASYLVKAENGFSLRIQAYGDNILRFRYAHEGQFEQRPSYALVAEIERLEAATSLQSSETPESYVLSNDQWKCIIDKSDMKVGLFDQKEQKLISQDLQPVSIRRTIHKGVDQVMVTKAASAQAAYFGLGDKSCAANLRGKKLQNWNTDAFGYGADTDPLYRSIPFYYELQEGQCHGIFFHNTHRTHFDFDTEGQGKTMFWAEGGEIDYFFIYGDTPQSVAQKYHQLTGTPELPPLWALGFHQCRWSYYPEARVRELASDFRQHKIPCDAIYLDIDYMDGYRCFTWNHDHFPDPKGMIDDLRAAGFQTVVMIDPGIRVDKNYDVYQSGIEQDVFCYRATGELMRGPVWPPDCVFPDFTNPKTRDWWGPLYRELYENQGVSGFWNDMNEPAVFMVDNCTFPDHVVHHYDGYPSGHRRVHNVYGQQMTRATFDGLKNIKPQKRPFVLTRATYSGGQRFASVWTGDNIASWEHLRIANIQCQRLSISGYSFVGTDIGGFSKQPDGELMVRWLQLGIFHPFFRIHSMGNNVDGAAEADADMIKASERANRLDQEPWAFGEPYTSQAREAIEFRYQLLPYLYTAFWQYTTQGSPILQPLFFHSPDDAEAIGRENEFFFGKDLLVMPVMEAGAEQIQGYFPDGSWLDYYTGEKHQGPQYMQIEAGAAKIPVFVRAGAVIPNHPVMQYTGEKPLEEVTLRVYHGASGQSHLYEDTGEGYDYQSGQSRIRSFTTTAQDHSFTIEQQIEGSFKQAYQTFRIRLFGLPFGPTQCWIDGKETALSKAENGNDFELLASEGFGKIEIK